MHERVSKHALSMPLIAKAPHNIYFGPEKTLGEGVTTLQPGLWARNTN